MAILLYELRQMVRNQSVIVLMCLYLSALVVFLGAVLVARQNGGTVDLNYAYFSTGNGFHDHSDVSRLALALFLVYYLFTSLALLALAAQTAADRLRESPVYCTMLKPRQIIWGHMLFGGTLSLLFLCMTWPFLSVVYLLRGLDIRLLPLAAFVFFGLTQLHYFTAMALALGVKSQGRLYALLLPALAIQLLLAVFGLTQACDMTVAMLTETMLLFYTVILVFLFSMIALFLLAMIQVAPESSNRMFPVRVTLGAIQFLLGLAFLAVCVLKLAGVQMDLNDSAATIPVLLFVLLWIVLPFLFLCFICERPDWSPRIRQEIPQTAWRRLWAFPFFTGSANAMTWAVLSLLWMALLTGIFAIAFPEKFQTVGPRQALAGTLTYAVLLFDYCATTLLLYNILLQRWIARQWNWLPLAALLVLFTLCCVFIDALDRVFGGSFGIRKNLPKIFDLPFLPLPWFQEGRSFIIWQGVIAGVWLGLLAVPGVPWIRRKWHEFKNEPGAAPQTKPLHFPPL